MTQAPTHRPEAIQSAIGDRYLILLALMLIGYAIFGKTFAYIGVPPLYIGEIVFAAGMIAFLCSRSVIASFAALPNLLLAFLIGWVVVRTLPYVGEFGFDALRDSVIVLYGGFAFIVTALLLEKPERLPLVIRFFRLLGLILVPLAPILVLMTNEAAHPIAGEAGRWSLAHPKIGTTAVHLSAAALLTVLGFKRPNLVWLILLVIGMVVAASLNRGAMLVIIVMLTFALINSGRLLEFSAIFVVAVSFIGIAYVADLSIPTSRRDISVDQLIANTYSVIGGGTSVDLSGTATWRVQWWERIINYTFNGPYFWSGKGFGINLGIADGAISGRGLSPTELTRSPHNGHLTILARAGVPGLVLWLLTLASWGGVVLASMVRARAREDNAWAAFFLFIFCYASGFLVDATFDVTLEGPMAGIWFWCIFGIGTGASMIYRAELARAKAAAEPPSRSFAPSMSTTARSMNTDA